MVKPIVKDPIFLARKSVPATEEDAQVAQDLRDTLEAHREGCVGMAANMIGVGKRVIIFDDGGQATVMFNPEILRRDGLFEAEEAASPSAARGKRSDTGASRSGIRTSSSGSGSRPTPAGRLRSSSTRSTTATGS